MSDDPKHTPVPWAANPHNNLQIICASGSEMVAVITRTGDEEEKANARFIVTACNSHADLLAVCKAALADGAIVTLDGQPIVLSDGSLPAKLRAAIAKAEA